MIFFPTPMEVICERALTVKRAGAVLALLIGGLGVALPAAAAADEAIRVIPGPVFADIDLRDQPEIAVMTREARAALESRYADEARATVEAHPRRVVGLRVFGAPLAFASMGPARRAQYMEALDLNAQETAEAHERTMAEFLGEILQAVQRTHPAAELSVFGLPSEGVESSEEARLYQALGFKNGHDHEPELAAYLESAGLPHVPMIHGSACYADPDGPRTRVEPQRIRDYIDNKLRLPRDYAGLICVDYEPYVQPWVDEGYEDVLPTKDAWILVIRTIKEHLPHAAVGTFGPPTVAVYMPDRQMMPAEWWDWLWNEVDIVCPQVYWTSHGEDQGDREQELQKARRRLDAVIDVDLPIYAFINGTTRGEDRVMLRTGHLAAKVHMMVEDYSDRLEGIVYWSGLGRPVDSTDRFIEHLSALGPIFGRGLSGRSLRAVNRHYDRTIDPVNFLISSKRFIFVNSEEPPLGRVRAGLREARRLSDGRDIYFRANNSWFALREGAAAGEYEEGEQLNYLQAQGPAGQQGSGKEDRRIERRDMSRVDSHRRENRFVLQAAPGDSRGRDEKPRVIYFAGKGPIAEQADLRSAPLIEDRVVMFYEGELGRYPKLAEDGERINGGLPQLADLRAHLAQVADDVEAMIPDAKWDGFAVIDYEQWGLVWEKISPAYREASKKMVRERHPGYSDGLIEDLARREYEEAARNFMQQTLQTCRAMRPKAKWGFWGYGRHWEQRYPQYTFVWELSGAFYPDLYAVNFGVEDGTRDLEPDQRYAREYRERIRRDLEFVDSIRNDRPVLGFIWRCYAGGPNNAYNLQVAPGDSRGREVNDLDLEIMLNEPWRHDCAIALWDRFLTEEDVDAFNTFYEKRMAPRVQAIPSEVIP